MTPSIDAYLKRLEELERKATAGNWRFNKELSRRAVKLIYNKHGYLIANVGGYKIDDTDNDANAELIAASRSALPKLVTALRAAVGALEKQKKWWHFEDTGCRAECSLTCEALSTIDDILNLEEKKEMSCVPAIIDTREIWFGEE